MTSSARNDDNRPTVEYGDIKYVRCGFSLFRLLGGRGNVASPTGGWATGRRTTAARAYKCDAMCHVVTRGSLRGVSPPTPRYTIVGRSDHLFYPFHPLTQWSVTVTLQYSIVQYGTVHYITLHCIAWRSIRVTQW